MKFAGFQLHHVILTGVGPAMQRVTECGGRAAGISYDFFFLEFWFEFSRIKSSHNRKLRFPRNYGTMILLSAFSEIFVALCKLCKFQIHIILLFSAAQLTSDVCCLSEYIRRKQRRISAGCSYIQQMEILWEKMFDYSWLCLYIYILVIHNDSINPWVCSHRFYDPFFFSCI